MTSALSAATLSEEVDAGLIDDDESNASSAVGHPSQRTLEAELRKGVTVCFGLASRVPLPLFDRSELVVSLAVSLDRPSDVGRARKPRSQSTSHSSLLSV